MVEDAIITNVKCGGDGTILISDQGAMFACGANTDNKLGLSETGGLFSVRPMVGGYICINIILDIYMYI